ncbi:hypothetical protein TNCV_2125151 [Trichonephila clavipes]|nr:hypothetical protein TNCV_2125151 [Trichonephila clavipes]
MDTILNLTKPCLVTANTDGSSDCNSGDLVSFLHIQTIQLRSTESQRGKSHPNLRGVANILKVREALLKDIQERKTRLAQNFNSLLLSIEGNGKILHPSVDIEWNKLADSLEKEGRTIQPASLSITMFNVSAVAKQKICVNPQKELSMPELKYNPSHLEVSPWANDRENTRRVESRMRNKRVNYESFPIDIARQFGSKGVKSCSLDP